LSGPAFPYESPRPGQEEVSRAIIAAALKGEGLAVEAPNGFGKTASALAAAISLIADQGFSCTYVVRTKREMERVLEEVLRFGAGARAAPLLSMADGCLLKELERVPLPSEVLPNYCRGSVSSGRCFFYDALQRSRRFLAFPIGGIEDFLKRCQTFRVCPYFLARDRAADSDLVVTTYPHLLDEALRGQLLGMRRGWRRSLVIFDEAHNLPEMIYLTSGRAISLAEMETLGTIAATRGRSQELMFCDKVRLWLQSLSLKEGQEIVMTTDQAMRSSRLQVEVETLLVSQQMKTSMMFVAEPLDRAFLLRLRLFELASSLARALGRDDSRVLVRSHGGDVSMVVRFLDVRKEFSLMMKGLWSPVFLSATFFDYGGFSGALGVERGSFLRIGVDPLERRCLTLVDVGVTTEYRTRGREQFAAIASRLANVARAARGSTASFFPSYDVLEGVASELPAFSSSELVKEERGMRSERQAEAVRRVTSSPGCMLLGVMGGRFSEGEDFASGGLAAVSVVGLPLPPPSRELSERMAFGRTGGGPWIYDSLVIIPAVSKVVQAAGRLFRRKGQRGVVVLLDRRFGRKHVIELFPLWLREKVVRTDSSDFTQLSSLVEGPSRCPPEPAASQG